MRSVSDEVEVEMDEVLVKEEPRVEGEELMENEYHTQLDPLVLRTETDLWCDCPPVGELISYLAPRFAFCLVEFCLFKVFMKENLSLLF